MAQLAVERERMLSCSHLEAIAVARPFGCFSLLSSHVRSSGGRSAAGASAATADATQRMAGTWLPAEGRLLSQATGQLRIADHRRLDRPARERQFARRRHRHDSAQAYVSVRSSSSEDAEKRYVRLNIRSLSSHRQCNMENQSEYRILHLCSLLDGGHSGQFVGFANCWLKIAGHNRYLAI